MKVFIVILSVIFLSVSCKQDSDKKSSQGGQVDISRLSMRWSDEKLTSPLNLRISKEFLDLAADADEGKKTVLAIQSMMQLWDDELDSRNIFVKNHSVENDTIDETKLLAVDSLGGRDVDDLDSYNDQTLGIYRTNTWFRDADLAGGVLAITQFFVTRTNAGQSNEYLRMVHADIIMNFDEFDFRLDNYQAGDHTFNFNTVILHELGHFLGLGHHRDDYDAVMYPYLDKTDDYLNLTSIDSKNIKKLYSTSTRSALRVANAIIDPQAAIDEGKTYRGYIELRSNGECIHYLDGVRTHSHPVDIEALKRPRK